MNKKEITQIEQYVIAQVKALRIEKGISQQELADIIDISQSFIRDVESPKRRAKYNLNHINEIAKALKCSPKDFLPNKPLP